MMRKIFRTYVPLFFLFLFFLGCGVREEKIINLAGSTSVQPLAELLAETYMKKKPQIIINVQGGGSSAGIEAVRQEVADIGMCSRPLSEEEKDLIFFPVAFDAVAFIVHPDNKTNSLSISDLQKIYSGEIKNWEQISSGNKGEIDVVTREEGSGTREAFNKMVMGKIEVTPSAIVQDATGVVREIVSSDKKAIGYISLGVADQKVKLLAVEGVLPSFETVRKNKYRICRPFLFVFKKMPEGEVKNFLDFVLSEEGQKIVKEAGFVPVKNI